MLDGYVFPQPPIADGSSFEADRAASDGELFGMYSAGSLFERLLALRGDEDVYCDLAADSPQLNYVADRIAQYARARVEYAVAIGADAVSFGDDYGTERALLFSPQLWRSFFKRRLRYIFEPAVKAGMFVHFHSCGMILPIIPDLREIGVTSFWPQLPAYDMSQLASLCRSLGLAVAVHTDRANTMTFGTPSQVRDLVRREYETFRMGDGGAWFYIEADNGFPFENIEALVNAVREYR